MRRPTGMSRWLALLSVSLFAVVFSMSAVGAQVAHAAGPYTFGAGGTSVVSNNGLGTFTETAFDGTTVTYSNASSTTTVSKDQCKGATITYVISLSLAKLSLPAQCSSYSQGSIAIGSGPGPEEGSAPTASAAQSFVSSSSSNNSSNSTSSSTTNSSSSSSTSTNNLSNYEQSCEQHGGVMGWLGCPVMNGLMNLATSLDGFIENTLLKLPVTLIFDGPDYKVFQQVWSTFRNLAAGLIVIFALIAVISEAIGAPIMDAYTIRKVLPRVLIAAVLMTFSWNFIKLAATLSNDVGFAMNSLIFDPFKGLYKGIGSNSFGFSALFVGGVFTTAGAAIIAPGAILSLLGVADVLGGILLFVSGLWALAKGLFLLIFRQMLFIFLLLTSPIAFVCYVLPGTQGVWKLWRDGMMSILLIMPVIAAFIALGHAFTLILLTGQSGAENVVYVFMAFITYFLPYFLIPKAFEVVGGFMSRMYGTMRNHAVNQGVGGFLGKQRQNARQRQLQNLVHANYGRNRANGRTNRIMTGLGAFAASGQKRAFLFNRNSEQAKTQRELAYADFEDKQAEFYGQNPHSKLNANRDNLLRLQLAGKTRQEAVANATQWFPDMSSKDIHAAADQVEAAGGFGAGQQKSAFFAADRTATAFDNADQAFEAGMNIAGHNAQARQDLIGQHNFISGQVGRPDMKWSFGNYMKMASKYDVKQNAKQIAASGVQQGLSNAQIEQNIRGTYGSKDVNDGKGISDEAIQAVIVASRGRKIADDMLVTNSSFTAADLQNNLNAQFLPSIAQQIRATDKNLTEDQVQAKAKVQLETYLGASGAQTLVTAAKSKLSDNVGIHLDTEELQWTKQKALEGNTASALMSGNIRAQRQLSGTLEAKLKMEANIATDKNIAYDQQMVDTSTGDVIAATDARYATLEAGGRLVSRRNFAKEEMGRLKAELERQQQAGSYYGTMEANRLTSKREWEPFNSTFSSDSVAPVLPPKDAPQTIITKDPQSGETIYKRNPLYDENLVMKGYQSMRPQDINPVFDQNNQMNKKPKPPTEEDKPKP